MKSATEYCLVLVLLLHLTFAAELTPCEIYTKDYECDEDNQNLKIKTRDEYDCETDFVGTTLALMKEGDEKIRYSETGEAALLIGLTGTGKSSFGYFVAGNESQIIAYKEGPTYSIKDCNGKIGDSAIVSTTIFPDLITDENSNEEFYDMPGFEDSRTACIQLANAYFMNNVMKNITKAKIIAVTQYGSVTPGVDKSAFIKMIQNIIGFVPNIEKFTNSLGLAVTKVPYPDYLDEDHLHDIDEFLHDDAGCHLDEVDLPPGAKFMVEAFIGREINRSRCDSISNERLLKFHEQDEYKSPSSLQGLGSNVGIFRVPNGCGPLGTVENMITNKITLQEFVRKLDQIPVTPDYFTPYVSDSTIVKIDEIAQQVNSVLQENIHTISDNLKSHLLDEIVCFNSNNTSTECNYLFVSIEKLYSNPDFETNYENLEGWEKLSYYDVILRLFNTEYLPSNFKIEIDMVQLVNQLDFIKQFKSDLDQYIDLRLWVQPLKDVKEEIGSSFKDEYDVFKNGIHSSFLLASDEIISKNLQAINAFNSAQEQLIQVDLIKNNVTSIFNYTEIKDEPLLSKYLENAILQLKTLKDSMSPAIETTLNSKIVVLHTFARTGVDTKITKAEQSHWMDPIRKILAFAEHENSFFQFANALYKDLGNERFQVPDSSEAKLKEWWLIIEQISKDILPIFWSKFEDVPAIKSNSYDTILASLEYGSSEKLSFLNQVLNTTLIPCTCVTNANSDETLLSGNFISVGDILNPECDKKGNILIHAYNTFFIDQNLTGSSIKNDNINVLLVSPNIVGRGFINLSGKIGTTEVQVPGYGNTSGKPGGPGGRAGNFVGVYSGVSTSNLTVTAGGGTGGNGQRGQNGADGENGAEKECWGCHARSGFVKVYSLGGHKCKCDDKGDGVDIRGCDEEDNVECHAAEFVRFVIYGKNGWVGNRGSDGGKGGLGGYGGSVVLQPITKNKMAMQTFQGNNGQNGLPGSGGSGGLGGFNGRDSYAEIDDSWFDSDSKFCHYIARGWTDDPRVRVSSGSSGVTGGNEALPSQPVKQVYDPNQFKASLEAYKTQAIEVSKFNMLLTDLLENFAPYIDVNDILQEDADYL